MKNNKTIEDIAKNDLCTGCGTCVGICPNSAIRMMKDDLKGIYIPKINTEICNQCGLCFEVCPGHSVDFIGLNLSIFGKEPEDVSIGCYLNCYIGHATDHDVRYDSTSGGLVTQLLIFALENGIIDGALVIRMSKENPLEPEPFIARTKEEMIEASKSKYCPVPANIALKEISKSKEGGKFAVVGLPCHIHGIRKAEVVNKKLKERIVLHIGIFCGHTPDFRATEFFLQKHNIKKENIKEIYYRGGGWPGKIIIIMKDGSKRVISRREHESISSFLCYESAFYLHFNPVRCLLCCDGTCELADISFGDAWLPELSNDKIGTSMVISRTERGEQILQYATKKGKIELGEITKDKAIQSQSGMLLSKKKLEARVFPLKMLGKNLPNYNIKLMKPKISDFSYLNAILIYLATRISSKRYLWCLLDFYTFIYLKIYLFSLSFIGLGKRKLKAIFSKQIT